MSITIATIAVLAALAAVFATLHFQDRKDAGKYERKADELRSELSELRAETARQEEQKGGFMKRLSVDVLTQFLREEKASQVKVDGTQIVFDIDDDRYYVECERLPRMLIIRKGYGMKGSDGIHWDLLQRAAASVTEDLVMVKANVDPETSYGFTIVCTDRTLGAFRENFDTYMSIFSDSDRMIRDRYWELVAAEYPDECRKEDEGKDAATPEEVAMKMAQLSAEHNKVQS